MKYGVGPSIVPRQLGAVGLPKSWVVNRAGRNGAAKVARSCFVCLVRFALVLVLPLYLRVLPLLVPLPLLVVLVCLLLVVLLAVVLRQWRSTRATWDVWFWVFFFVCGRRW